MSSRVLLAPLKRYAEIPDLLLTQKQWFAQFEDIYLNKLFEDICPVADIAWEKLILNIGSVRIERSHEWNTTVGMSDAEVDRIIEDCKKKELTYWWIISAHVELIDRSTGEKLFVNERAIIWTMPLISKDGSYVIWWVENIVISQIIRSYWLFYDFNRKNYEFSLRFVPINGAWMEITVEKSWSVTARINKTRKFPITALLRVLGLETDEIIQEVFEGVFDEEDFHYVNFTLKKDTTGSAWEAALFIYNKLRPWELIDEESAIMYIKSLIENERLQLWWIARRKINAKLWLAQWKDIDFLDLEDVVEALKYLFNLANQKKWYFSDDADHLWNKRVRTMWELLYAHLVPTMRKFQKTTRWKLSVIWLEQVIDLIKTEEEPVVILDDEDGDADTSEEDEITKRDRLAELEEQLSWAILALDVMSKSKILIKAWTKLVKKDIAALIAHNIERITIRPTIKLVDVVNFKSIDTGIRNFFAQSQLSSFWEQRNPIAEIESKRKMTALGPWWLKKETAKFDVRDIHISHYGRICPVETPEWQTIWLVINQALYSKINKDGFIETPAVKVYHEVHRIAKNLVNRISDEDIVDAKWNIILGDDSYIDEDSAKRIESLWINETIKVRAFVTWEIEYLSPEKDHHYTIADTSIPMDEYGNILLKRVPARHFVEVSYFHISRLTHVDVNSSQLFSPSTSIIPFADHDDSSRANMGTNMQRQAVPLLKPEAPFIGTWLERDVIKMTSSVIMAQWEWEVIFVWGKKIPSEKSYDNLTYTIKVKYAKLWIKEYNLPYFVKSNQKTIIHMRPVVSLWQTVYLWDIIAEWQSVVDGEIALGKNLRVAFLSREWHNYEDAIVISNRLVKQDELTSVHIEQYEIEVADTKLWSEETTPDIPWVSLWKLKDLDENGIIRIWSVVKAWDLLVGKITPKSEWELSAEEKLIQAVFGDKSKNVKDTSLYLPSWTEWKVIDIVTLDSKTWDRLPPWVKNKIKIYVASTRKIEVWDKLAWRHGNKWIISIIMPEEDMPYTEDGQPIDIILNSHGVISRMNIWQSFESQLGLVAKALGINYGVPLFSSFGIDGIQKLLVENWLPENWKMNLYDWRNWEKFVKPVTIWYMYMLKLDHMVEDKIHARSVGPYSLITWQPLQWKARSWWQRFWEMEVWALEAYWAVHMLQEMLTIKSDDMAGRNKAYESIIKWQKVKNAWAPESYNLLVKILQWLGQNITTLSKEEKEKIYEERLRKIHELWLRWVTAVSDLLEESVIDSFDSEWETDHKDLMKNIIEDLVDYGQLEE